MKSLARFCVRHRWYVLFAWLALFIVINVISQSVGSAYSNAFSLPGTNSTHAESLLSKGFPQQSGDIDEIVFQSTGGTVASHQATIQAMLLKVEKLPEVGAVISPFCSGSFTSSSSQATGTCQPALVSKNGTIAYAVVKFSKTANHLTNAQIKAVITKASTIRSSSLEVQFGGNAFGQLNSTKGSPFEAFGLIATAIVLVLAFGSFFAMLLPLGVALFALGIALAGGILLSHVLAIAQFAPILGSTHCLSSRAHDKNSNAAPVLKRPLPRRSTRRDAPYSSRVLRSALPCSACSSSVFPSLTAWPSRPRSRS